MTAVFRNTPVPITVPTTRAVVSASVRLRTSPVSSRGMGGGAQSTPGTSPRDATRPTMQNGPGTGMKDGALRRTVKAVARGAFLLNVWSDRGRRRWLGERPYLLGGACQRCAACCEAPAIRVHALVWLAPRLRRFFLWWQEQVNGFVLVEAQRRERTFVFRCSHFDRSTRSCDSYA